MLPGNNFRLMFSPDEMSSTGAWVKTIYEGNIEAVKDAPPHSFHYPKFEGGSTN